jgi:hypothetical protein
MPDRSDCKHSALLAQTGQATGHVDDLEQSYLETQTGNTGDVNALWLEFFQANGASSGDFNTAAYQFLIASGIPAGALPDMWTQYWCNLTAVNIN